MTTDTPVLTAKPEVDAALSRLQAELDALDPSRLTKELEDMQRRQSTLENQIAALRRTTSTLANLEPRIAAEVEWRDHLVDWRAKLCDELMTLPPRIRTEKELGTQVNLTASIRLVDFGVIGASGYELENLFLAQLMKDDGFVEGAKVANQLHGPLPWSGSMKEVVARIAALTGQRDAAQAELEEALLSDDQRDRLAADRMAAHLAERSRPRRKVRGDGSQYDQHPDGRITEVEA